MGRFGVSFALLAIKPTFYSMLHSFCTTELCPHHSCDQVLILGENSSRKKFRYCLSSMAVVFLQMLDPFQSVFVIVLTFSGIYESWPQKSGFNFRLVTSSLVLELYFTSTCCLTCQVRKIIPQIIAKYL